MKKISILTLIGYNYGGCLQAYALKEYLKDLGFEPSILYYDEYLKNKITFKKIIKDIVYFKRNKKFNNFKKENLELKNKIKKIKDDGSIFMVGSDQIWNSIIPFAIRKNFYLSFVKDKKRKISYAASIGNDILDKEEKNINTIKKELLSFNSISVREETAKNILNNTGINNVEVVLDPTLLYSKEKWLKFRKKYKYNNYLLVYTLGLDKKYYKYINDFSIKNKTKIIDIFYKKRFNNTIKNENNFGPIEFINSIYHSNFVITNSFHGTVFSILFHKEFITITRCDMNSRVFDLLRKLGLENRIINENELITLNLNNYKAINYNEVDKIINNERIKSKKFLEKALDIK